MMNDRTVADFTGHDADIHSYVPHAMVYNNELVGIEFELERMRPTNRRLHYWYEKEDGSLRNNGLEYVLKVPLTGADLYHALREIQGVFRENRPDVNVRCSTHVHLDVRDLDLNQLRKLLLVYLLYEQQLYRMAGVQREKSVFCVPASRARYTLELFSRPLSTSNDMRYGGLNTAAIGRYGSLEFRQHEGTTSIGRVLKWVNVITSIKAFVKRDTSTPDELSCKLRDMGPEYMLPTIFGKAAQFLPPDTSSRPYSLGLRMCKDLQHTMALTSVDFGPEGRGGHEAFLKARQYVDPDATDGVEEDTHNEENVEYDPADCIDIPDDLE